MLAWLITIGEPLPIDPGGARPWRTSLLASALEQSGHRVVRWTSTFDHTRKVQRFDCDTEVPVSDAYTIRLLYAPGYARNVSPARIRHHKETAATFARMAAGAEEPNVILCSLPTLELCDEATRFGRARGVPVALDVRDLWPDALVHMAPGPLQPVAEVALSGMRRQARRACAAADAILGVTDAYVDWGVRHAGRPRTDKDRAFAMGYSAKAPPPEAIADAEARWDALGVRNDGTPRVCFFGTLGRQFDLRTAVRAAAILERQGRRCQWVVCGSGEALDGLRKEAAGLTSVLLPGWVGHADVYVLLRRSTAGLAPYRDVPHFRLNVPNKPAEYLSAELPILCGVGGALQQLVRDSGCGICYRAGSPESLAGAVRRLSEDSAVASSMRQASRRLFEERFVAERVYAEMADHLERLSVASQGSVAGAAGQRTWHA